jgi:hypothetical protein
MSQWERYALPCLRSLADPSDHHLRDGFLAVGLGERGGDTLNLEIEEGVLFETLFQLRDLKYVAFSEPMYESGGGALFNDLRITGRGLQVLGEWPRFEAMVSPATLGAVIDRLAEFAPEEEQRTAYRRGAGYVRAKGARALKTSAIALGAQAIRGLLGLP